MSKAPPWRTSKPPRDMRIAYTLARAGALIVIAGACMFGCANSSSSAQSSPTPAAEQSTPAGPAFMGTHYPPQGHVHLAPGTTDTFKYNSNPATSGPHREIFSDQFISPQPLPVYVQVHLLEHGNVLLQYSCSCPEIASQLADIAGEFDKRLYPQSELLPTPQDVQSAEEQGLAVIVAPYPNMKSTIALTAWTRLATLDAVDKAKIVSFINQWLNNQQNLAQ